MRRYGRYKKLTDIDMYSVCEKKTSDGFPSWNELSIGTVFDGDGEAMRGWFKRQRQKRGIIGNKNKTRILCLSDFHCPYNVPISIFQEYSGKVDILVLNGDIEDCQGISKFSKKYRVPFVDEMVATRKLIIDLIEMIKPKKVFINYGNHEQRMIHHLSEKLHEDLLQLMPETPLDLICDSGFYKYNHEEKSRTKYEPIVDVFKNKVEVEYTKNWWNKVGKTVFAHPKAYKSGVLATVEKAYLHFLQKGIQFDCIVLAHTHAFGMAQYGQAKIYEQGGLCEEQEYTMNGGLGKPQAQGFFYQIQDEEGNFIYDESKLVSVG